ncbi:MAG: hypothetical protein DMG73_07240 [Acidobacteria bacterium]|nr:MAG: hypothetical protein DMG73_07240 [Acidobacteriota bacterium]
MNAIAYCYANAMESDTSAIARGLRRRDPDLLDRLIEQYQHRLLRYLVYLSGNRELAEDLFQETWIRVLERGHQYDGKHEFSTWLYAVARNLTIDYLRKKSQPGWPDGGRRAHAARTGRYPPFGMGTGGTAPADRTHQCGIGRRPGGVP